MTNALAAIPLTFDGTDIQEDPIGLFLEIVRGLNEPMTVRGTDTIVPSLTGRIARNRKGDRLLIELRGLVIGNGATHALQKADFAAQRQIVRALFDTKADPAPLVATLEDATTATINARTLNVVWIQGGDFDAEISVELEAVEDWTIV